MDAVTGLGQTFASLISEGNTLTLNEVDETLKAAERDNIIETRLLGEVVVNNGELHLSEYPDNPFCKLDTDGYCSFGSILGIPSAYMKRLNRKMREENIAYWTDELNDKKVTFQARDGFLVEVSDNDAVTVTEAIDVLNKLLNDEGWVALSIERQTNSTTITVANLSVAYTVEDNKTPLSFHYGVRVVVPEALKAINVYPVLVSEQSCGVVQIEHPDGPVAVRNSTRAEVLEELQEKIEGAVALLNRLNDYHIHWEDAVNNPTHRVDLYCREHSLPDRVAGIAHDSMDEFDKASKEVTYSDIVCLFANIGYNDVVKPMSRVKCEKLAGHVLMQGAEEHRCPKCDSLEI